MSWLHHVDESDRERLEDLGVHDLAKVVRMGFFAGLSHAGNQARKRAGLAPVQRPYGRRPPVEEAVDDWVEGVVRGLYERAGRPGASHLAWLEAQFRALKPDAEESFREHEN